MIFSNLIARWLKETTSKFGFEYQSFPATPERTHQAPAVCGDLYVQAHQVILDSPVLTTPGELVSGGFWIGQMEKVYLGASMACMFRIGQEEIFKYQEPLTAVARIYNLESAILLGEYWFFRPVNEGAVRRMMHLRLDSPEYHQARAILCGIPEEEVDIAFHEVPGYKRPHEPTFADQQSKRSHV